MFLFSAKNSAGDFCCSASAFRLAILALQGLHPRWLPNDLRQANQTPGQVSNRFSRGCYICARSQLRVSVAKEFRFRIGDHSFIAECGGKMSERCVVEKYVAASLPSEYVSVMRVFASAVSQQ